MGRTTAAAIAVGWMTLVAGCSSGATPACVPGRLESCPCIGGGTGVQQCRDDGTFGACACGELDAGIDEDDAGTTPMVDSGADDASVPDVDATIADATVDDATVGSDAGVISGHVVVMGVYPWAPPDDAQEAFVANSVFVSERPGTLRILDYIAHSNARTEPYFQDQLHAQIDAEATRRGRTVTYAELTDDLALGAALASADVLFVYPQLLEDSAARTIAGFWHDDLVAFLRSGGVVSVPTSGGGCGPCGNEMRLVEGDDLFAFTGGLSSIGSGAPPAVEIAAPADPIAEGIASPFVPSSGNWYCYPGSARGTIVARTMTTFCPVVRHLEL